MLQASRGFFWTRIFLIAAAVLTTFSIAAVSRAGVPALSGGGPANGQDFAPIEALIDIVANEPLSPGTVSASTVTLYPCTGSASATSCASPNTATNLCTSISLTNSNTTINCGHAALSPSTTYIFTVGTGVQSASTSNSLAAQVSRTFRTSSVDSGTNTTGPRVVSASPSFGATSVPTNTSSMSVNFTDGPEGNMLNNGTANAANNAATFRLRTLNSSTGAMGSDLCQGTPTDSCALTFSGRTLSIVGIALSPSTTYDACIVSGVKNTANVGMMGDWCWTFSTGTGTDGVAPALRTSAATTPVNGAVDVSIYQSNVRVSFSEAMSTTTISPPTVRLYADANDSGTLDGGESVLSGTTLELIDGGVTASLGLPTALTANTKYCFSVVGGGSGVKDLVGNAMGASVENRCFRTAASEAAPVAAALDYVDADNFKLIARFNQPMQKTSAETVSKYALECPTGVPVNLTGKTATYFADRQEVEIEGLGLPANSSCRLTITGIKNLAGVDNSTASTDNVEDFIIQDSAMTGGFLGGSGAGQDFFSSTNMGSFWESPERCEPQNRLTGKTTSVFCEFPAPAAMPIGSKVILTFPTGFSVTGVATLANSWSNTDLNGPAANKPTISAVAVNATARTVTVTTATAAIASGDQVMFELSGLVLPTASSTDNRVTIIAKDDSGVKIGQTINPAPFDVSQGGSYSIAGSVYKDTDGDSVKDAGEGISGVKVYCDQMGGFFEGTTGGVWAGHQETTTNGSGDWSVGSLSNGQFGCGVPPDPTNFADMIGGNQWRDVVVSGANVTGVNFKFTDLNAAGAGAETLTVTLTGDNALATKQVDVFCHAGASDMQFSAPVMKTVTLNSTGDGTATLKLLGGKKYDCGVGPHMDFSNFSSGGPPPVPEFDFLPPPNQNVPVVVGTTPGALTFTLSAASNTITGAVCDGGTNDAGTCGTNSKGTGIANVYVNANPLGCFNTDGSFKDCRGGFAQSKSNGTFTLNVVPGAYRVEAFAPGMPPIETEVTVLTNGTVTQKGVTVTSVLLKLSKSSTTIAGTVKDESGNGIAYSHVGAERVDTGGTCASFVSRGAFRDTPSDSSGNYTLYVSDGTWIVRAWAPSYGEVGCTPVVISGSSATGKDIQATAGDFKTISGTAPDGAFINAFGTSGGNSVVATSGAFNMKVKAGTYTVECFAHGKGPCGLLASVDATSANQTVNFSTTFSTGTVNVTMTNITDAFVDIRGATGLGAGTSSNSAGVYTLALPAGTYSVRGGSPKYGELCNNQSVTVVANATFAITCAPPENLRTVEGRVTDGSANVAGSTVLFTDSNGKSFKVTSTAEAGVNENFTVSNVPDGTYTVKAQKNGYGSAITTAVVSGGNLTISSPLAITQGSGASGDTVTVTTQSSSTTYAGEGRVVATTGSGSTRQVISADIDTTSGTAALDLPNGTWTVKAIGANGKESSTSTVVVTAGTLVGSAPTLGIDTAITGFTAGNESTTMSPKSGVKASFPNIGTGFEVNIPASVLSTSDSSTGKIEVKKDPTVIDLLDESSADTVAIGTSGYEITPKDANGNALGADDATGATITVPYADAEITDAGANESTLVFGVVDSNGQYEAFPTTCDTTLNLCTVQMQHFSTGGLVGAVRAASTGSVTVTNSGGSGGVTVAPTTVDVKTPGNGEAVTGGKINTIEWTKGGNATDVDIYVSYDDGGTFTLLKSAQNVNQSYLWQTPNVNAAKAKVRADIRNGGEVLATDVSNAFTIVSDTAQQEVSVETAQEAVSVGVTLSNGSAATLSKGSLFRGVELSGVYYVDAFGKRSVFPDEATFFSYYNNFDNVLMVQDDQLRKLELGKRMRMNKGSLIKIQSDPKVYEVQADNGIRHVPSETSATARYGAQWAKLVRDVSVVFFFDYTIGAPLTD